MFQNWKLIKDSPAIKESKSPFYLHIRDYLAEQISNKTLRSSDKLPSERILSQEFSVTRITIRESLQQLEVEGLLYRANRKGWFVTPPRIIYKPQDNQIFEDYVSAAGRLPKTETLSIALQESTRWTEEKLGVTAGKPIYSIKRKRSIDHRPVLIEEIYINPEFCPGLTQQNLNGSLTKIYKQHYGFSITSFALSMCPTALTKEIAEALEVTTGISGIAISSKRFDEAGNLIEFAREYWLHDSLEIQFQSAPLK
ncbi:MAG: GntR family transcriptional regulator [SAR324 cluster bacterium]|uniref:GntR family transcriptional regulator n=1 Tax=SAR324 cluster bacterium TaxID=2024889 RepID=A0A2A4SRU7_9DELT|nr:MAG: GntR family transcriptional regulator [SAR324 cluster bacterium]